MIEPGDSFIHYFSYAFIAQIGVNELENCKRFSRSEMLVDNQSAKSQPLMCIENIVRNVCRQERIELVLSVNYNRMVLKSVVMIVHVIPEKEKQSVFRCIKKRIPFGFHFRGIGLYFKHFKWLRNS